MNLSNLEFEKEQYRILKTQLESFNNTLSDGVGSVKKAHTELNYSYTLDDVGADNGSILNTIGAFSALISEVSNRVIPLINSKIQSLDTYINSEHKRIEDLRVVNKSNKNKNKKEVKNLKKEKEGVNFAF